MRKVPPTLCIEQYLNILLNRLSDFNKRVFLYVTFFKIPLRDKKIACLVSTDYVYTLF